MKKKHLIVFAAAVILNVHVQAQERSIDDSTGVRPLSGNPVISPSALPTIPPSSAYKPWTLSLVGSRVKVPLGYYQIQPSGDITYTNNSGGRTVTVVSVGLGTGGRTIDLSFCANNSRANGSAFVIGPVGNVATGTVTGWWVFGGSYRSPCPQGAAWGIKYHSSGEVTPSDWTYGQTGVN